MKCSISTYYKILDAELYDFDDGYMGCVGTWQYSNNQIEYMPFSPFIKKITFSFFIANYYFKFKSLTEARSTSSVGTISIFSSFLVFSISSKINCEANLPTFRGC